MKNLKNGQWFVDLIDEIVHNNDRRTFEVEKFAQYQHVSIEQEGKVLCNLCFDKLDELYLNFPVWNDGLSPWTPVDFLRLKNKRRHDDVVALVGRHKESVIVEINIILDGAPLWN